MKNSENIRVLIAEDSPTQAEVLKYILEKHNYGVMVAKDGKEALAYLQETKPTIVISDIIMPEMSGYKLCKAIKSNEHTWDIPVILLTSLSRAEDVLDGLECGADNFVTKPYAEDYLIATIDHILANKEIHKIERKTDGVEIKIGGNKRIIKASPQQMLTLLLSTYEAAAQRNIELVRVQDELKMFNVRLEELVTHRTAELSAEINVRRSAEQVLEAQHALLTAMINSSPDLVIFSLDNHYCYTSFNEKHREEMKQIWKADISTGDNILDCMTYPELRELAKQSIDRALAGESFVEIQYQKDHNIYFEFSWNPIFQHEDVVGVTVFISDISMRKRSEETLRRQTERLKNLHQMDQDILQAIESPEAIAQTALQHLRDMLKCHAASVGIFDLEKQEIQAFSSNTHGNNFKEMKIHLSEELNADMKILQQGKTEIVENMSGINDASAKNRIFTLEGLQSFISVPLLSAQRVYGVLNIGWEDPRTFTREETDIAGEVGTQITIALEQASLLKETKLYAADLEKRVTERTAQLEAAIKEMETFSYSVSHDLRAPLRHISGFISLFLDNKTSQLTDEELGFLKVISNSAEEMGTLIDALLAFSRLSRTELKKTHLETLPIITQGLQLFEEEIKARKIDIKINPLTETYGDLQFMRQVWINLISNAIKYTGKKEKAIIEIGSYMENSKTIFSIKDNGAGFNMKYADKLFGLFQRLHKPADFEGIGIGLANINRIITRHGGHCWAEGETDKGATFYFSLPVAEYE